LSKKISNLFLLLVFIQASHSLEEYIGKLWENFPPATFLCGLISDDLHFGFVAINIGLFVFGILCWVFLVKTNHSLAIIVIWFWIILELINGIGHPVWTIIQKDYTPGVVTAPFLFITAILLLRQILIFNKKRSLK
jgi:hypothetical protein